MKAMRIPATPPRTVNKIEDFRQMAHEELDRFIDKLIPFLESEKPMTLQEISDLFQKEKHQLLGGLLQRAVEINHRDCMEGKNDKCPLCGRKATRKRNADRHVETLQGPSQFQSPYFYCDHCCYGFSPLDSALELAPERKQYDLQRRALSVIAEMPFETASRIFKELTGINFSDSRLHGLFEKFTDQMTLSDVIPDRSEIERRIRQAAGENSSRRPIMVVASDGAHVPSRASDDKQWGPGEYREAKGFRIYMVGQDRNIHQLMSWHQIQDADSFCMDIKQAAACIPIDKVRIALIGDGAGWLWRAMKQAFPSGREVLDYYHCSEHIHDLAKSLYSSETLEALQWAESTMSRLFHHEVVEVIEDLNRIETQNKDVKDQIRKLIGYLSNNQDRIHYAGDRRGGYPIGSGGIESANKFICHTRLKRSGAWWLNENSNGILRVRCSIVNGTFDKAFSKYVTLAKAKKLRSSPNS